MVKKPAPSFEIHGIEYQIIRSRRKTVTLVIGLDGQLVVRTPLRLSKAQVEGIVLQKEDWIQRKQAEMKKAAAQSAPNSFLPGSTFWYLGKKYPLEIVKRSKPALNWKEHFSLSQAAAPRASEVFTAWYIQQSRAIFALRLQIYASSNGFSPEKLRISSARTRWGSCSSKKTISLTWRLVMAPLEVIDYVVVHELVHLHHPNHSKDFWQGVEAILPDYRKRRAWLKKNGRMLTL
jgi:predicted metal-dependent hydrolase